MTHASEPTQGLISAAHLIAAFECARRIRAGEDFPDVSRYVRMRGEKLCRELAPTWALLPDPDPIDVARAIEPLLGEERVATVIAPRVIDGVTHRFITGTGWCPPLPRSAES